MKTPMKMQTGIITIEEGFERWTVNCKRRGLTENTFNYYHTVSNVFMGFMNYKTPLESVNKKMIDDFVMYLMDKGTKVTSINTYLRGLRAICYFWMREEYIKPFKIQRIRCDEEIKETFSADDIKKLLKKPNIKTCSFLDYESWVLCNALHGLGARAGTICGLRIMDLDFDNGYVSYTKVKDRKQTILPMGDTLMTVLKEFLVIRKGQPTDFVFVHAYGGELIVDRLSEILNRYYIGRGVDKTGVHIWRRTFAKDYIRSGGNSLMLQAQLCHKTLDMTKKYVNLYATDLKDDRHNPLEMINQKDHMKMR